MTSETTGARSNKIFDSDTHDQETKKLYYHMFDDKTLARMKKYFNVKDEHEALLRYLRSVKVPPTTPDHV